MQFSQLPRQARRSGASPPCWPRPCWTHPWAPGRIRRIAAKWWRWGCWRRWGTWWRTTHGELKWVSSPQWFTWDFWSGLIHSYWSYVQKLSYRTGAPHCSIRIYILGLIHINHWGELTHEPTCAVGSSPPSMEWVELMGKLTTWMIWMSYEIRFFLGEQKSPLTIGKWWSKTKKENTWVLNGIYDSVQLVQITAISLWLSWWYIELVNEILGKPFPTSILNTP